MGTYCYRSVYSYINKQGHECLSQSGEHPGYNGNVKQKYLKQIMRNV